MDIISSPIYVLLEKQVQQIQKDCISLNVAPPERLDQMSQSVKGLREEPTGISTDMYALHMCLTFRVKKVSEICLGCLQNTFKNYIFGILETREKEK